MRVVIFAMVGLAIGLGAGGGVGGLRTKKEILQVRADSVEQALAESALSVTHSDSTHAESEDGEHRDPEASQRELPADVMSHAAAVGEPRDAPRAGQVPSLAQTKGAAPLSSPDSGETDAGLERLGKIFMAMKPRDAAAVLTYLNDAEVEAILFQLREKNAAEILGSFPPDRAAVLSRSVLAKSGGVE